MDTYNIDQPYMSPDDGAVKAINKAFYRNVDFPIRAFIVPDSLRASKPEAYFPQVVGFGPLHHSRLQVQSMQLAH